MPTPPSPNPKAETRGKRVVGQKVPDRHPLWCQWPGLSTTPPGQGFHQSWSWSAGRMPTPLSPNPKAETRGKRVVDRKVPGRHPLWCQWPGLSNHNSPNRQAIPEHLISSHLLVVESFSWAAPPQSSQTFPAKIYLSKCLLLSYSY